MKAYVGKMCAAVCAWVCERAHYYTYIDFLRLKVNAFIKSDASFWFAHSQLTLTPRAVLIELSFNSNRLLSSDLFYFTLLVEKCAI